MAGHLSDCTQDEPILIIGFGNLLRGDDGVGPRVAETIARWNRPGVLTLAVHQLLPEMAEALSNSRFAIFVDADLSRNSNFESVRVTPLTPCSTASPLGHVSNPAQLLALAQDVIGRCPAACLIRVPVCDMSLGESLSALAQAGANAALHRIAILLDAFQIPLSVPIPAGELFDSSRIRLCQLSDTKSHENKGLSR